MLKTLEKAGLRRGMNVLEIGCGTGRMSLLIAEKFNCNVTGVDKSRAAINKAAECPPPQSGSVRFLLQDVDVTGEAPDALSEKNLYDVVCSECALSLIRNRRRLSERIYASLAPAGRLVLLDMRVSEMEGDMLAAGFTKVYERDMSEELLSWAGQIIFEYGSLPAYFERVTPAGEDASAYCGWFAGESEAGRRERFADECEATRRERFADEGEATRNKRAARENRHFPGYAASIFSKTRPMEK